MESVEPYPYADSDILWNDMMASESLLYAVSALMRSGETA
jgi:hypothetical protein